MYIDERALERLILDAGLATEEELRVLREGDASLGFGERAVLKGVLTERDLRRMEAYLLGLPFLELESGALDLETLSLIPEPLSRRHGAVAYKRTPEALEVALVNARSLEALDFLKKRLGIKLLPRLTSPESLKSALLEYQRLLKTQFGATIQEEVSGLKVLEAEEVSPRHLAALAESREMVRITDLLLKHALLQGASDIHIEPHEEKTLVRYRVSGHLHDAMILPARVAPVLVARLKSLAKLDVWERARPQEGRFRVDLEGEKIGFRVTVLPVSYGSAAGEKVVMRVLRENAQGYTLESLGVTGECLETLHAALARPEGLIVVAGERGSGKATTLYTMLDTVSTPKLSVATVEEEPGLSLPRVSQTYVHPDLGLTSAAALRTVLRQDPDVLMVGNVRDGETASLAAHAALSGHVVLAGLTAPSAASALHRLLDLKLDPLLIASSVRVVSAQRLVRALPQEKESYALTPSELKALGKYIALDEALALLKAEKVIGPKAGWGEVRFARAVKDAGKLSQTALFETLTVSATIKELLIRNASAALIEKQARKEGMRTLLEDGLIKAAQGLVPLEDVLAARR